MNPPKLGLEFSAHPTIQEIFRVRVFEEPLVPIGGEPSAEENAALADALLGYAKRSGPDDFAGLLRAWNICWRRKMGMHALWTEWS